jgi:hypothetical protein
MRDAAVQETVYNLIYVNGVWRDKMVFIIQTAVIEQWSGFVCNFICSLSYRGI